MYKGTSIDSTAWNPGNVQKDAKRKKTCLAFFLFASLFIFHVFLEVSHSSDGVCIVSVSLFQRAGKSKPRLLVKQSDESMTRLGALGHFGLIFVFG